jgi:uncharacterized membrane protein YfcA
MIASIPFAWSAHPILLMTLIGMIIFAAQVVSTVTGFGNNILALPPLTMLVGLPASKAALILLGTLVYSVLVMRWWRRVKWRELLVICVVGGVGLVAGMYAFHRLPQQASIAVLGVFVLSVGLYGLLDLRIIRVPNALATGLLFLGGAVHGAFTVGGPLIVIHCRRAIPDRTAFRSTLNVAWIVLNLAMIAGWMITRAWPAGTMRLTLVGLPFSIAAVLVGEWIHHRVHAKTFQVWVNVVLVVTGVMLIVTSRSAA